MKVIGIGDNVVDVYLHQKKMYPGGNALNFSVYAKKIGLDASYMGVFGNDLAAEHITKTLKELEIDTSNCRYHEGENAFAEVNIIDGDRIFIGTNKGGIASKNPIKLNNDDLKYIKDHELVHTSCYSQIENELEKINNLNIPISFDFSKNYDLEYIKEVCPYITFSFLSCSGLSDKKIKEKLKETIYYGSEIALATRGEEGAILLYKNKFFNIKAKNIDPVDTLGAGDAFITAFLVKLLENDFLYNDHLLQESMKAGVNFASEICHVQGAFNYGKKIK